MEVRHKATQKFKAARLDSIAQGLRSRHPNALAPPSSKLRQITCPARLHNVSVRNRHRYTGASGRHADFALFLAHLKKEKSRLL
jgi:hypothetical protein